MSYKLSTQLKSERGIYSALTALNPNRLEEMITDAEALEKQLKINKEKDSMRTEGYNMANRARIKAEKQMKELKEVIKIQDHRIESVKHYLRHTSNPNEEINHLIHYGNPDLLND